MSNNSNNSSNNFGLYLFLGAYQVLQNLFGADIDEFWWFVPMTFCWSYEENLEEAKDFIVVEPKGQLISKCPFDVTKSNKKPTKILSGFLP